MFARGVVYLHAAHLPVPKSLSAKSSVSVSSKLIEIKGLQLQHFGHLRKTGGRGSYRLVHTAYLPLQKPHGTKSNYSGHPTKDVHPEPAEGLFSYSSIPVGQHRAISIQPAHYSAKSSYSGHPTKDVHPEPAEGLFSYSSIPVGQHRAISIQPAHYSAKSSYSRTYAIPRGVGGLSWSYLQVLLEMSARRHL
jgi:hypothetical protein